MASETLVSEPGSRTLNSSGQTQASTLAVNISRLLVVVALVAQVVVAWKFWQLTWDDSAITLGFSRTFAFDRSHRAHTLCLISVYTEHRNDP